jgi:hypothetical protein
MLLSGQELVCGVNGEVVIPAEATKIGEYAFYGRTNVSSLSIHADIKQIGAYAFYGCDVSRVYIDDISAWCGVGLANADSNPGYHAGEIYLRGEPLTVVNIPHGVPAVNFAVFYGYDKISSIALPDTVKTVFSYAFYGCRGVKTLDLGNGLQSIMHDAFTNCKGISAVTFPDSLQQIKKKAFYNCSSISLLDFGNIRTTIPELEEANAFDGARSDYAIAVPDALYDTWIGETNWSSDSVRPHIVKWSERQQ